MFHFGVLYLHDRDFETIDTSFDIKLERFLIASWNSLKY